MKNKEARIKFIIIDKYTAKKQYRCSLPDQREIDYQINELLHRNLIKESGSPFAALFAVTLAFKKEENRESDLCIDF